MMVQGVKVFWRTLAPVFIGLHVSYAADPQDARWDFRFGAGGLNGAGYAALTRGQELFVGGTFTAAGSVKAALVARWSGRDWYAVGEGFQGTNTMSIPGSYVLALANYQNRIYAGGEFTSSGTNATPGLASWDGSKWMAVGNLAGEVYGLTVQDDYLYVVGHFQFGSDTNVYGVARWDGATWENFGSLISYSPTLEAAVYLIAVKPPEIFIAGEFTRIAGQTVRYSARWNGAAWEPFEIASNAVIQAMSLYNGDLYVSGSFESVGGVAATNIAYWSGTRWSPVAAGLNTPCTHLLSFGNNLYAAGSFTNSGDLPLNSVAKWDGSQWSPVGGLTAWGRFAQPYRIAFDTRTNLYATGYIESLAGQPAENAVVWNGSEWSPLNSRYARGPIGFAVVRALATESGAVFAGGTFSAAGGVWTTNIGHLGPTGWSALGAGVSGSSARVAAIATQSSNVYAGGIFTNAGGQPTKYIAQWNGTDWSPLDAGVNSNVLALAAGADGLFAAGDFTRAGDSDALRIARWNGAAWNPVGAGFDSSVTALAIDGRRLYAAGRFTNSGDVICNRIACWNGNAWQSVGGGVTGSNVQVLALAAADGKLYAGGRFSFIGGVAANNVAVWDGVTWAALGDGSNNGVGSTVQAIAVHGGKVFVGGSFTNAGDSSSLALACWNGTNWSSLGSGLETAINRPRVLALAYDTSDDSLYVGGLFQFAGGKPANGLARWVEIPRLRIGRPEPNPAGWLVPITGVAGLRFIVETSTNPSTWNVSTKGEGETNEIRFREFFDTRPRNFYRFRFLPGQL